MHLSFLPNCSTVNTNFCELQLQALWQNFSLLHNGNPITYGLSTFPFGHTSMTFIGKFWSTSPTVRISDNLSVKIRKFFSPLSRMRMSFQYDPFSNIKESESSKWVTKNIYLFRVKAADDNGRPDEAFLNLFWETVKGISTFLNRLDLDKSKCLGTSSKQLVPAKWGSIESMLSTSPPLF